MMTNQNAQENAGLKLDELFVNLAKNKALPNALRQIDADSIAASVEASIMLYKHVKAAELRKDDASYRHFKGLMFETMRGAMRHIDECRVTDALRDSYPLLACVSLSTNSGLLALDEWILRYQFGMRRENISKWWLHIDANRSEIVAQLSKSDATMTAMLAHAESTFESEEGEAWHYNSKSKVVKIAGAVLAAVNVAGAVGAITGIGAGVAVASALAGGVGMLL